MFTKSSTFRDQAYEQIRNMIIKQEIPFGSRISVAELSRQFGISNSPIREAISLLEMDGLLVNSPDCGLHVINFNKKCFFEVTQTIKIIQAGCYDEIISLGLEQELINTLTKRLDYQELNFNKEISFYYSFAAINFDKSFVDVVGNDMLTKMFEAKFNLLLMDTLYLYQQSQANIEANLDEHREMLKAVKSRDHDLAMKLIKDHYDKSHLDFSSL